MKAILLLLFICSHVILNAQESTNNPAIRKADFEFPINTEKFNFHNILQTIKRTYSNSGSFGFTKNSYVTDIEFYNNSSYFFIVAQILDDTTYIFSLDEKTFYLLMISVKLGDLDNTFIDKIHKEWELPIAVSLR